MMIALPSSLNHHQHVAAYPDWTRVTVGTQTGPTGGSCVSCGEKHVGHISNNGDCENTYNRRKREKERKNREKLKEEARKYRVLYWARYHQKKKKKDEVIEI